jgi:hypothetical protein
MIHQIIATGSIGMNAEQQTRDEESMSFSSLNEVSSKFIDVANGDSQKYADLVSGFDETGLFIIPLGLLIVNMIFNYNGYIPII